MAVLWHTGNIATAALGLATLAFLLPFAIVLHNTLVGVQSLGAFLTSKAKRLSLGWVGLFHRGLPIVAFYGFGINFS